MAAVNILIRQMQQLEEQLVVCMRCGMCQSVCPLYASTGREADVARGKLALLDGLMKQMLTDPAGTALRLNKCLLCGSCEANCPSGVSVMEIFLKARAILTGYMGLPPAKKLAFKGLLAHPRLFDQMARWAATFQKLLTRPANDVIGTSCARFRSPLIGQRHLTPLARTAFHRLVPALDSRHRKSGLRVGFYTGCLIDKIFPRVALACLKALEHHEVDVFIPPNQACCGIPAVSSGDLDTFAHLVRHNVKCFSDHQFDFLLTACATCTSTIKKVWPLLFPAEDKLRPQAEALAAKTMDIHAFLVHKAGAAAEIGAPSQNGLKATYHDPCHLKKSLGVFAEPRQLIRANPDYCLQEMHTPDRCCGMGGSFNLQYYEISARIGNLKKADIAGCDCDTVATGCPACMLQIADMLSRDNQPVAVRHAMEIYAAGL